MRFAYQCTMRPMRIYREPATKTVDAGMARMFLSSRACRPSFAPVRSIVRRQGYEILELFQGRREREDYGPQPASEPAHVLPPEQGARAFL